MEAVVSGFRTEVRSGIQLTVGQEALVDFALNIGEVSEKVTVEAEAPLVQTSNATLSGLVDDKTIRTLPLNGRSFGDLVLMQVDTIQARRSQTVNGVGTLSAGGAKISISGARPQANSFLLDGTDVNDYKNTMPGSVAGLFLGVETVREFRVLTNSFSAEYGRSAGGVITAVTRSGTNGLHGAGFEFLRNSALDARNFFTPSTINPFKRNQFGFTLGGPIKKNKTFFFGSYEGLRDRLGVTVIDTVPDAQAHQGIVPRGGQLVNVGVAPGVAPWLALFPLPNSRNFGDGTAQYIYGTTQPANDNNFNVRVDQSLTQKHSFFARYTFDDGSNAIASTGGNGATLPFQKTASSSRNQYLTTEADSILSQSTLNAFRFGYNRSAIASVNAYTGFPAGLSLVPGVPFSTGGQLTISGLSFIGYQRGPGSATYNLFEWSDDVTHTWGRHTMKTGIIFKRIRLYRANTNSDGGYYNFSGGLAAFLQGQAGSFQAELPCCSLNRDHRQSLLGFYGQDEFKATSRLTVNLGVREEFMTSPVEVHGAAANMLNVMDTAPVVGNPYIQTHKLNVAPRFGIAWDSLGNSKLVIRAGYGIFYDQPLPTYWTSASFTMPPFAATAQLSNVTFPTAYSLVNLQKPVFGDIYPYENTGTTYAMQYDFTIQSQIARGTVLTVGYAGSQGRHLVVKGQENIKIPVVVNGQNYYPPGAPRRNPVWGNVRAERSNGTSNYNALVVNVNKTLGGGFQIGGSYTYAKIMSIAETVYGSDGLAAEQQLLDPYNLGRDRSPADYSEKHNLSINYSYNFPNSSLSGIGRKLANGWQVNGITRISSGAPFPALSQCCSGNGSSASALQERPNLVAGRSNNPVLGGPDRYFDVTAFADAPVGFLGNVGRNTLVGPGLLNFDMAVVKNTPITERLNLQFRAEIFNIFNRANFSTPAAVLFNSSGAPVGNAAVITSTDTTSREIQFALKLVF
jgi:hypothetical protein